MAGEAHEAAATLAAPDKPGLLQKLINLLIVLVILIHPTQVTLKYALQWLEPHVAEAGKVAAQLPALNFTPADVLILLIVPLWLIKCLFAGGISSVKSIPLAVWVLIIAGALSLFPFLKPEGCQLKLPTEGPEGQPVPPMDYVRYAKDLIQYVLSLMVAYVLFASSAQWPRTLKGLVYTFLLVATVVVGYGALECAATQNIALHRPEFGAKEAEAAEATPTPKKSEKAEAAAEAKPEAKPAARLKAVAAEQARKIVEMGRGVAAGEWVVKKIEHPMDIDSTFGFAMVDATPKAVGTKSNRNVLGAFLCLVLPLSFGLYLFHPNWFVKLWMLLVTLAGLGVVLSGGAFIAISAALLVVAAMRRSSTVFLTLLLLGLVFLVVYPKLPRENHKVILDSLMLKKSHDLYGSMPAPTTGKAIPAAGQWQQKYTEWQAALNAISLNPHVGVGLGHYQKSINAYYATDLDEEEDYYVLDKAAGVNYMEPDSGNHYLVLATEAGIPAMLALIWIITYFARRAGRAFAAEQPGFRMALAAGLCGSMVAFAIGSIFTVMLVRGLAITLVLLLAFVHGVSYSPAPPREVVAMDAQTGTPSEG